MPQWNSMDDMGRTNGSRPVRFRRRLASGPGRGVWRTAAVAGLALALGVVVAACGVSAQWDEERFAAKRPLTIAVLPFHSLDQDPVSRRQADFTRQAFVDRLLLTPYTILEPRLVDHQLRKLGITRSRLNHEWPAGAMRELKVDAALAGELTPFQTTNFGLYTAERMEGRFRLFSLPEGETLWEAEYDMRHDGGLIINSGQVLAEIGRWSEPLEELYVQSIDLFVHRVVETFPPCPEDGRSVDMPEIGEVAVTPSRPGPLGLGDRIEIALQASPALRVVVRYADGRRISLMESAPGRYRGVVIVMRGEHYRMERLDMDLVTAFGDMFVRTALLREPVVVDARPEERGGGEEGAS